MAFISNPQALQTQVKGALLTPNDALYEETRLTWNRSNNHFPALILVAEDAEDIVNGVNFARGADLGIAIQSTGHGTQIPADEAFLIVTKHMKTVEVDADARLVRVEAGAVWKDVLEKCVPHGLAPLLGSSPHVGVIGYTLGGGIGWLARRYGLAADHVRSIDVVTADGVLRHTSVSENSDLFWGLLGGGGNFGVVTAITFELFPLASLYGGNLFYSGELAQEALCFFRDWVKTLPDELTSSISLFKYPPLPQLPKELHGKVDVVIKAAYLGDEADGAKWIQPWLDWHTPKNNTFRQMPFAEIATISNDPVDPVAGYGSNELLAELSDEAIAQLVSNFVHPAAPLGYSELRHAGGAISQSAPNAVGNRDAQFYWQMAGMVHTPEAYAAVQTYIQHYKDALRPYLSGGVYLNFMKGDESAVRTKDGYSPESYQRLLDLKAEYDPENRFRYSYQLVS